MGAFCVGLSEGRNQKVDADIGSIYVEADLNIDKFMDSAEELKNAADIISGAMETTGEATEAVGDKVIDFSKVLDKSLAKAASKASDMLGDLVANALGLDAVSGVGSMVAQGVSAGLSEMASALGTTVLGISAVTALVGYGLYELYNYASGAKDAREALKDLGVTAEKWISIQATSIYDTGTIDALARFNLSKYDFASAASESWLKELQHVWTDGTKETEGVIQEFTDGFIEISDEVRTQINARGSLLEGLGVLDDVAQKKIEEDLNKLQSYDEEVEALLKKWQNGSLTEKDQIRMGELAQLRAELQIEYGDDNQSPFGRVTEGLRAELDRTLAMGAQIDTSIYGDTLNALARGHQAYMESINQNYDAQHAQIMALEDIALRENALKALNDQYNRQRLQGEQAYSEAIQQAGKQVWDAYGLKEQIEQIDTLAGLLSSGELLDFKAAREWANNIDEGKLASMIALVEQLKASGMSDSQMAELGIDVDDLYAKLTQIRDITAGLDDEGGKALYRMFATALPEEIQRILVGLDMTEAKTNWESFMEGKDPFEVNGHVTFEKDEPPISIRLSPLDKDVIRKWEAENANIQPTIPMAKVDVVLGTDWESDLKEALDSGLLNLYDENGILIEVAPEVLERVTKNDLVAMDEDGMIYVIVTPDFGTPEAIDLSKLVMGERTDSIWSTLLPTDTQSKLDSISSSIAKVEELRQKISDLQSRGISVDESGATLGQLQNQLESLQQITELDFATLTEEDLGSIASQVANLMSALNSGSIDENIAEQYKAQLQGILDVISAADQYLGTGNNVSAGIAVGMQSYGWGGDATVLAEAIRGAIEGALGVASPATTLMPTGEYVSAGIGEGMKQYSFENDAATVSIGIVSAFSAMNTRASAIGRNFSSGLASGIRAGQSGVISAAIAVAQAAAAAARSTLAIHSPSRVTEELGKFFDLGFIRGVEGMMPDVRDAIRAAVYVEPPAGVAYGASREVFPTVRVNSPTMDYDALAEAMNRREVALYLNDRRMAQGMAGATARAQNARNRKIARGYGK